MNKLMQLSILGLLLSFNVRAEIDQVIARNLETSPQYVYQENQRLGVHLVDYSRITPSFVRQCVREFRYDKGEYDLQYLGEIKSIDSENDLDFVDKKRKAGEKYYIHAYKMNVGKTDAQKDAISRLEDQIEGKQDELAFNTAFPEWRLLYGDFGAFLNRFYVPKKYLENIVVCGGYIDDLAKPDPPETYPGTIGNLFISIDLGKIERGRYEMFMQESYLPHYKAGDERGFQNVMDYPLKIRARSQTVENGLFFVSALGKKYK